MPLNIHERIMRPLLLLGCMMVFLVIPLKIISYGYLPGDDALRHTAFAVDNRNWNEVLLLNPEFHANLDSHPGWHAFLRFFHQHLGFTQEDLVILSVTMAFVVFTWAGLAVSGNPLAWQFACAIVAATEHSLFQRFLLGRPMFFSMTALAVMLFVWTRSKPVRPWVEALVAVFLLTLSIYMHPTVWYLWSMPGLALVLCKRWRSAFILGGALVVSICLAALLLGSWYNVLVLPMLVIKYSILQDPLLGTSLVGELQPSGGPTTGLLIVAGVLMIKWWRGGSLRDELSKVDFVLVVMTWLLGMHMMRFWFEWGLPALTVWLCRQIKQILDLKLNGFARVSDSLWLAAFSAGVLFMGTTADIGGRYTQNLKSPLLTKPVDDFRAQLPDEGGILYTLDMTVFYKLYYRMPDLKFRFSTGFEPGFMRPEDLKVFRAVQFNENLLDSYGPWIQKMTPKDRLIIYYPVRPVWPEMEFTQFYSAWIGKKVVQKEKTEPSPLPAPAPQLGAPAKS